MRARKGPLNSKMYRQAALASAALIIGAAVAEAAPKPANPVPLPRPRPVAVAPKAAVPVQPKAATKSTVPLAVASTAVTGADDLAAVRQAIDLVKKDKLTDATDVAPHSLGSGCAQTDRMGDPARRGR